MKRWLLAVGLVVALLRPAPARAELSVDWDVLAAAGAGLVAGILGLLIGAKVSHSVACGVEGLFRDEDCSPFTAILPTILGGLALGFAGGYLAIGWVNGDLGDDAPPPAPNVGVRFGVEF